MSARLGVVLALLVLGMPASAGAKSFARQEPFTVRPLAIALDGVCYGPHRDGQRPGGPGPTRAQLAEDIPILARHWHVVRTYNAATFAGDFLDLLARDRRDLKVLLGCWIGGDEDRREIEAAVRLARRYPTLVRGIIVGNETQVSWSANRLPAARLIAAIREVRARTTVPVTTADDFNYWNKPESDSVAREVDVITTHLHPLWNGASVDSAVIWVAAHHEEARTLHPDRPVIVGEAGWATAHDQQGDQGRLMRGAVGEAEQARVVADLAAWTARTRVPTLLFEAFDERWKGGDDPTDAEKHWGVFHADRTPKLVMTEDKK